MRDERPASGSGTLWGGKPSDNGADLHKRELKEKQMGKKEKKGQSKAFHGTVKKILGSGQQRNDEIGAKPSGNSSGPQSYHSQGSHYRRLCLSMRSLYPTGSSLTRKLLQAGEHTLSALYYLLLLVGASSDKGTHARLFLL